LEKDGASKALAGTRGAAAATGGASLCVPLILAIKKATMYTIPLHAFSLSLFFSLSISLPSCSHTLFYSFSLAILSRFRSKRRLIFLPSRHHDVQQPYQTNTPHLRSYWSTCHSTHELMSELSWRAGRSATNINKIGRDTTLRNNLAMLLLVVC